MSAWTWGIAAVAYLLATAAIGKALACAPLRPRRWLRRRSIAQTLCDRVEFFGMGPSYAWMEYERTVGGLARVGGDTVRDALSAAYARKLAREVVGYGLDVVSEIPARHVLSDPHHLTRVA